MIGARRWARAGASAALLLVAACTPRCGPPAPTPEEVAQRAVLVAERDNLREYLGFDFGRLLVEGDLLAVVREELVGELLAGALPVEGVVPGGYGVRLVAARVSLGTGLARVELDGVAWPTERPSLRADLTLYASLDVAGIGGDPPVLRARVEPLALAAREVRVGEMSAPVAGILEELARRRLADLAALVGPIELPVSVRSEVTVPAVAEPEVRIAPMALAVGAHVERVLVAQRRLWVQVGFDLDEQESHAPAPEPRSTLRPDTGNVGATIELDALREQVANVRRSVEARLAADTVLGPSRMTEADVLLRLSSPRLLQLLDRVADGWLDEVELDLRPNAVVEEGDTVRVRVGPVRVTAGDWTLRVTIQRVRASLAAGDPDSGIADGRLELGLPVQVLGGSGVARVQFSWDARRVVGAVCSDFAVDETLTATVSPTTYRLEGSFDLELEGRDLQIVPDFDQRLEVRPEPTAEAWLRVRELLESQDRIFRCGLALDPEQMEGQLRDLLRAGFRFRLPPAILRPIRLPAGAADRVRVGERDLRAEITPVGLRLAPDWLWYGVDLGLSPLEPEALLDPAGAR